MRLLVTGASGFIGTNYINFYAQQDCELLNLDIQVPLKKEHEVYWKQVDIMVPEALDAAFIEFQPTHVVHMAARAECDENTTVEEGYSVNTVGTQNVLDAIKATPSIERVIIISTQYVAGPGRLPEHDEDYFPHTVYGQSKVITEQLTRKADLDCIWTFVRPTNIWGPWHMRYQREAWHVINKGLYMHPGGEPVIRSYGYVGNIVWQMNRIFELPEDTVNGQVFYVGDRPIDIYEWVDGFSLELKGKHARKVPRFVLAPIGMVGDLLGKIGKEFPLTSSRYKNMISDYLTPMDKTFEVLGEPPFSLEGGICESVKWLNTVGWK
jgi:nucleoside-diphosphate-sugar epimerase